MKERVFIFLSKFIFLCKEQKPFFKYFLFSLIFLITFIFLKGKINLIYFYNHVVTETKPNLDAFEKQLHKQIQKAPSLWLLKLDFLAFFSILNRIISVFLIFVLLLLFFFFFIYNFKFTVVDIIIFYLLVFIVTLSLIHIGFSHFKMALIFDNFHRLVSNNILNIKKIYIIIFFFLAFIALAYIALFLYILYNFKLYLFDLKFIYFNFFFDFKVLIFLTLIQKKFFVCIVFSMVVLFIYICLKYIYICCLILNCHVLLQILIKLVCFWKSLCLIKKIYFKHNIHLILLTYPELVTLLDKQTMQYKIMFNPKLRQQRIDIWRLIDAVSDKTYSLFYKNFDLDVPMPVNKFMKFVEDTYLYLMIRIYSILFLAVITPQYFFNNYLKA